MAILTVENLGHSFGDRTLFKDVSFRLVEGDHIGLVGANGVGKSTLMFQVYDYLINEKKISPINILYLSCDKLKKITNNNI